MSMYAKKEDLYKAKAEYYMELCETYESELKGLAAHWLLEGGFLDTPHDAIPDRAAGKVYTECGNKLTGLLTNNG